jgi:hypothetical protein
MKLRIYGDFSLATESYMTMQVYGVNEIGSVSADWTRRNHGWILELSQFNDNSQGSFCR